MRKILLLLYLIVSVLSVNISFADDGFDDLSFDDFAIVDDVDTDMPMENVSLNSGLGVVNVKQFDIAGVMLGMTYEEVNNLFFNDSNLMHLVKKTV